MADNFAGSDCRYYHAKTVKSNSGKFLIGGKDKEQFHEILSKEETLKKTLKKIIYLYGYEELHLAEGKFTARKKYGRGDTEAERIDNLLKAMTSIADAVLRIVKEGAFDSSAK